MLFRSTSPCMSLVTRMRLPFGTSIFINLSFSIIYDQYLSMVYEVLRTLRQNTYAIRQGGRKTSRLKNDPFFRLASGVFVSLFYHDRSRK